MSVRYGGSLIALVLVTSACVPTMRTGPSPFDATPHRSRRDVMEMSVVVTNDHWLPMRVWVEWPDRDYFLGSVEPGERGTFSVPGYLVARAETLRLYADPTGSIDYVTSDPIDVTKGHRIEWLLRKVLTSSRARIM